MDEVGSGIEATEVNNSPDGQILTINGGSSSLKFALFQGNDRFHRLLSGSIDRIGKKGATWITFEPEWNRSENRVVDAPNPKSAIRLVIDFLDRSIGFSRIRAVGHRIVHGGNRHFRPELVTTELIAELRNIAVYDPVHLPGEIDLIEAFAEHDPSLSQVVCFDTAFHYEMPRVAQIVPIPRRYESAGVRRYGFHGLSYAYLMGELARIKGATYADGRVILAHLGAGASLAAVLGGRSIDTTMGLTPTSGLVMGTRAGDLDPGLFRFLRQSSGMSAEVFDRLVNHESGLLGISETSSDTRDLLAVQKLDVRAAEAIDVFCYQVKKGIGAYAAALGGLDTLVFSGGIGEHSPEIRQRICDDLQFLGITLDPLRNESNSGPISTEASPVKVLVIHADEEYMIAKSVLSILEPVTMTETNDDC